MAAAVKRRWYIRPTMSDMAADGNIGTGLKRCIHRHLKLPDQRSLRPPKLLLTKSAISLAAEVGHGCRWSHWNRHDNTHLHLDRRPLRLSTPFWHKPPPLSCQIDRSKRAAAVRYCGDFNTVILSQGQLYMTYTLSMVLKKIIFRLIRPK